MVPNVNMLDVKIGGEPELRYSALFSPR
jgi:hypothetical protein